MEAYKVLKAYNIGRTQPRVAIMDYLMRHHTHPCVDTIYNALREECAGLSRTTVYNTVKLLAERGAVTLLSIDERNICVDANITPHAHLQCKKCGKIVDLPLGRLEERTIIEGNLVQETHLYYKGICKDCLDAMSESEEPAAVGGEA